MHCKRFRFHNFSGGWQRHAWGDLRVLRPQFYMYKRSSQAKITTYTKNHWLHLWNGCLPLQHHWAEILVLVSFDVLQTFFFFVSNSMRHGIFCFQSTAMAFDIVNEVNVYTCTGQPLRSDIANIVEWMLNEDFNTAFTSILFTQARRLLYGTTSDKQPPIQEHQNFPSWNLSWTTTSCKYPWPRLRAGSLAIFSCF